MSDDERRERLQRFDAQIKELADAVELGRKVIPIAQVALVVAGVAILAITIGAIGFDPVAVIGASAALLIGILFLAWRKRKLSLMATLLRGAQENRAQLIDHIDPSFLKK